MTSTTSFSAPSARSARTKSFAGAGRAASVRCSSTSIKTSSRHRNCWSGSWRRRRMASSASATRTRRCTDGAGPACAGSSTSTSPTRGSSGSRWPTTTAARPTSSKRPRRLIEHNDIRFPKEIQAKSAPSGDPALRLCMHETQPDGADEIAALLAGRTRGEIVVLARTTNLLRTVALGCSVLGVRIAAPEQVFEPAGARGALEAYVRLCADPANADAEDVARVCRAPGRGLPLGR